MKKITYKPTVRGNASNVFKTISFLTNGKRCHFSRMLFLSLFVICSVVGSAQQVEVTLSEAGTLSGKIASAQKYQITSLKVSGPINGTDVRYLMEMAGRDSKNHSTDGSLVELDLTDAKIVEGGYPYFFSYYTDNGIIGSSMFRNSKLKSIKLPNSVTSIDEYAFEGCTSLTTVTIPNSVTSIGEYAFEGCTSLTTVTIPNSVTSIGEHAFEGCTSLTTVTIPNSVTSIGWYAFEGCTSLTTVTIPNSVTSIGGYAFEGCTSLKTLTIEDGDETLDLSRYSLPLSIEKLYLGRNLSGEEPSFGKSLAQVIIGSKVTSLRDELFRYCNGLVSITIPSSVTSIGRSAFPSNIKKVILLPNSVPSGFSDAFASNNVSCMIYVANSNYNISTSIGTKKVYPHLNSMFEVDGVVYVPVDPSKRTCDVIDCNYAAANDAIVVPEVVSYKGVTMYPQNVNKYAFIQNKNVVSAALYNSGSVGDGCFSYCSSLTSATVGGKVASLGDGCFSNCSSLTSATVGGKVASLGDGCFSYCSSLTSATVGGEVTSLSYGIFSGCSNLSSLSISDNVTEIGKYAFRETGLKSFSCPSELTSMGNDAFSNCKSLSEVKINGKLTELSPHLFDGCTSLQGLSIPANVKSVADYAFRGCSSFATLVIENDTDVLTLGCNGSSPLFADCPLDSVYVGTHISYNTSSDYGYSPFYRNTTLRSVHIGDNVREVLDNEFYGCTGLKSTVIGEKVAKIGNYAFSGCSSMESFLFGKTVESIGDEAFSDCTALTKLETHCTTPPTCGAEALDDINKWNCTLYVPNNSLADYQSAAQWKEFFFIEEKDFDGVESVPNAKVSVSVRNGVIVIDGGEENASIDVYDTMGRLAYHGTDAAISGLATGIYIVKIGNKSEKVKI